VQRWVLARLRHRRFFSLMELHAAIRELVDALNDLEGPRRRNVCFREASQCD